MTSIRAYRRTYVVKARNAKSWLYKRYVPRDLQNLVGKKVWTESLGRLDDMSALAAGRARAARDDQLIARLRALTVEER